MILHLKELLKSKCFTSVELAERLGVTVATVSYWLNGKYFPSESNLVQIAEILEVPVWQLFAPVAEHSESASAAACVCPHCGKAVSVELK